MRPWLGRIRRILRMPGRDVPPAFTGITLSVNSGPAAGGTTVVITGLGFTEGCTVDFGGAGGTVVSFADPSAIVVTTPAHAAGAVTVTITNPDGQSGGAVGAFTFT